MGAQLGLLLIIITGIFVLIATHYENKEHATSFGE